MRGALLPAVAGALLLVAGCATEPTSFYTLSAAAEPRPSAPSAPGLRVGLGPVVLPPYLERPEIVTREGPNGVRLAEYHRWAEPLEPLLVRTISGHLYALLDAEDVVPVPQRRDAPLDRVVEIEVLRLDADEAGQATLDARWWVYGGDGATLLQSGRSRVTEAGAPPPDYGAIVAAMSRAIAAASRDIAAAVRGDAPVPEPAPRRLGS